MTDSHDINGLVLVGYWVDDSIIADADAPPVLNAAQFPAIYRAGVLG